MKTEKELRNCDKVTTIIKVAIAQPVRLVSKNANLKVDFCHC